MTTVQNYNLFPSGYYSNRNPLSPPADRGDDAVLSGLNMVHSTHLTWKRAPGRSRWSNQSMGGADTPLGFFDYFHGATQRVIVDRSRDVIELSETGFTTVATKGGTNNKASFVAIQDILYMTTNSVGGLRSKKIGSTPAKTWGITAPTVTPTLAVAAGATSIRIGWRYVYVYRDNSDQHLSSSSPPSISTGPQVTPVTVTVTATGTDQTRVTNIDFYRTKDGGSTLFFLATVPNPGNTTIAYADSTIDDDLNTALISPSEHSNDPPPIELENIVYHALRIWGISGNNVVATGNTIDGLVNGIAEECFPPYMTFKFTTPKALKPTSEGLLVFTQIGITYLIRGTSRFDFDVKPIYENVSLLSADCVAKDGDIIYVFTSTRQILQFGDGVKDLGAPLKRFDLQDFDPRHSYLVVLRNGVNTIVYLSNNNNKMFAYDLSIGTWSTVWQPDGSVITTGAIGSVQTRVGERNLLIGPVDGFEGYVWKLNDTITNNDGIAYPCHIVLGSFIVAEQNEMASLEYLSTEATHLPQVGVLIQEIVGTPETILSTTNNPPILDPTTSLISTTHYPQTLTKPWACRHFQTKISWEALDEEAELFGFGFGYQPYPESQAA